jgi:hypothetical protein
MLRTYRAILRGNQIEWRDALPTALPTDQPIAVHITILQEVVNGGESNQPGQHMAAVLEQLAAVNAVADIADPGAWERAVRTDRPLPDRDAHAD